MRNFNIYYGDGTVFLKNKDNKNPPSRNVQAITQPNVEVGFEIVSGADYYVKEDQGWRGVDIFGLFDYLMDSGSVLFGKTISSEEYSKIMKRARKDQKKSGWLPFERKA